MRVIPEEKSWSPYPQGKIEPAPVAKIPSHYYKESEYQKRVDEVQAQFTRYEMRGYRW